MKKLIIFDFDGTLFNTVKDVIICFNKVLTKNNFPTLTYDEYIQCLGGNIDEAVNLILKNNNSSKNCQIIKKDYEKCYNSSKKINTRPYPKIHKLLKKLQNNNYLLAINSNRKNDSINYYVNKYFDDIDFVAIEGHNPNYPSKPSPIGVNNIIEKVNVDLNEVIYVGDSTNDILTSKNAKIDCVIVKWGYGNSDDYENEYPLKIMDEINELEELFFD